MTKTDQQLLTDTVRLTCPLNIKEGLNMLCIDRAPCLRTCTKVGEFWLTYRLLKDKKIEL